MNIKNRLWIYFSVSLFVAVFVWLNAYLAPPDKPYRTHMLITSYILMASAVLPLLRAIKGKNNENKNNRMRNLDKK